MQWQERFHYVGVPEHQSHTFYIGDDCDWNSSNHADDYRWYGDEGYAHHEEIFSTASKSEPERESFGSLVICSLEDGNLGSVGGEATKCKYVQMTFDSGAAVTAFPRDVGE